jgi:hypothetical protein
LQQNSTAPNANSAAEELQASATRVALAHYVVGLGHLGLGETDQAKREFALALKSRPDDLGAKSELSDLP